MIVELRHRMYPLDDAEIDWEFLVFLYIPENGQQYLFDSMRTADYGTKHFTQQEAEYFAKDMIKRLKDGRENLSVIFPRFCDKYPGVKLEVI